MRGCQGLGTQGGVETNGQKETFCDDRSVVHLDFGGGYGVACVCQNAWHCTVNILDFKNILGIEI